MKVLIIGNYGADNLGDEAILEGVLQSLIKTGLSKKNLEVLSANPAKTQQEHQVKVFYVLPCGIHSFLRGTVLQTILIIRKTDKIILGGGGLFNEDKFKALLLWGEHVLLARIFHKPLFIYANSIGPVKTKIGEWIIKKVFSYATVVSVRDRASLELLLKLGITQAKIHLTTDAVCSLPIKIPTKKSVKKIVFSFRGGIKWTEAILDEITGLINWLQIKKYQLILVSFQKYQDSDLKIIKSIEKKLSNTGGVSIQHISGYQNYLKLIQNAQLVIGTRLHSTIFALLAGIPVIGISYSLKVRNFMEDNQMGEYVIDLNQLGRGLLQNLVKKTLAHSTIYRQKLIKQKISLQKKATVNLALLKHFLVN
ncbi:hypothetical protein COT40_00220 [Candidatus Peregrinibacteria bacterium CG08_land_8_20_14_0_20_41_10]|nr:MAG: hypothetical protein AUJ78_00215 [Candidatus Peregrinibacteria bacterium CG1_02_41_10]PIS32394.1 MAG: hypothetical protein COT40_00220 [Candidatus Peregrinibacteria bacterium CG08_land_8_20_14_0_20_41_10]